MSDLREIDGEERLILTSWGSVSMLLDCPWCIGCLYYDEQPALGEHFFCRTPIEIEGERVPVFDLDSLCRNLFAVKSEVSFPAAVFASTAGLSSEQLEILASYLIGCDQVFNPNLVAFRLSGETGLKLLPKSRRRRVAGAVGGLLSSTGINAVSFDLEGIAWYVDPVALLMQAVTPEGEP